MRVLVVGDLAVNFKALPEPMFTGTHEIACEPIGKFAKIAWDIEGTKYEGSASVRHNFQKPGNYQVSVEIISEDGRKAQNSVKAVVYPRTVLVVSSPRRWAHCL
jgi:hypothetical protein